MAGSGKRKKILISDDEKHLLKMLKSRLKNAGYEVITADDGEEALTKIRRLKPDLCVLDLAMPGRNGYQVCGELKKDGQYESMPIIILSAWVRDKAGEDTALADLYINKPFEPEHLLGEITRLLEGYDKIKKPQVS